MKIVVFGGAGRTGSYVCQYLVDNLPEACVQAIDNLSTGSTSSLHYLHSNPRFEFTRGNIEDISLVEMHVADADYVINCVNTDNPDNMLHTLVVGTHNILECLAPEQHYIHCDVSPITIGGEDYMSLYKACITSAQSIVKAYKQEHNYRALVISQTAGTEKYAEELSKFIYSCINRQNDGI